MGGYPSRLVAATAIAALGVLGGSPAAPAASPTPKHGGVLNVMQREALPSMSIHEEATISTVWPVSPCYNNLVRFDPFKSQERMETVVGDLAERWEWQDGGKALAVTLHRGVKWHDGQPFSSRDVKYTFDTLREAPGITARLRVNPRKLWYENVVALETPDPVTVVFRLKHPQSSLLLMLASGYGPVYPAHVPLPQLRTKCVGTGPFRMKEYRPGESLELERNPDYFVKDRPYLDGLRYIAIKDRATKFAALEAGRLDVSFPGDANKAVADEVKRTVPQMVTQISIENNTDNIIINHRKPPFNDPRVRRAISLAIDRKAYVRTVHQGGALPGGAMAPKPYGVWGLSEKDLASLPGYGNPVKEKAEAKKLLAEAGYGPSRPLKVTMSTRSIPIYLDFASFVVDQLKQVGIEAILEQVDTGVWHPKMTRREFELGANVTGIGPDDPDANFFENYKCGSPRNYSDYCNPEVDRLIEEQSQTMDPAKRLRLVQEIDKRLQFEGARPIMGWRILYFQFWPYVKGLVAQQSIYNFGRMQDVWMDK